MSTEDERIRIIVDLIGDKAWRDLERDAKRFAETSKQVTQQQKALTREKQVLTKTSGALGNRLQNSAFQLGDFLVQVEAGVPATRAFGQQASQLLGAFGPWGAVLGVAAATVPILVAALRDGEEAAADLKTALSDAAEVTGRVNRTFSSINFDNWNEQFNSATESTQRLYAALLNIDALEAQRKIAAVKQAILTEIGDITTPTVLQSLFGGPQPGRLAQDALNTSGLVAAQRAALEGFRGANLMDEFGVDEARARTISNIMQSFETGLIDMSEFSSIMIALAGNTEDATEEFYNFARQLAEAEAANRRLLEVQKQQQAVQESLRTGSPLPTRGRAAPSATAGGASGVPGFNTAGNLAIMADGPTDYQQSMRAMLEEQRRAAAEMVAAMEELRPLGEQVFGSFTRSFDQMVNGIAQGTQSIKDAFGNMARALIADLIRLAAYRGILALLGGPGTALGGAFASQTGQLQPVQGFARGGVVSGPTMFPMSRGLGLMGEAGAEGIFPLGRLPNGDLGVQGSPMQVTINNNAPGVDVTATQGPGGLTIDVVRAVIAGDIARGGNAIANSIAGSYGLQRAGV